MINKQLSANATGIAVKETAVSNDKRKGVITEVKINPITNSIIIEYQLQRLDDKGKVFTDVKFLTKKQVLRDIPEMGTVEYGADGITEVEGSYTKIKDEKLTVTNWYNSAVKFVMEEAIKHVETLENI